MVKKHSLFEEGVLPVGLSLKDKEKGWQHIGRDIDYQKSFITR
jgi:murein tripeptide amidase MpaA